MLDAIRNGCNRSKTESPAPLPTPYDSFVVFNCWGFAALLFSTSSRLAGESMAELCRAFGISRKTGYKIFDRYQECGIQGLTDRSRRPYRYANQLPFQVENFILNVKHEHPSLGCSKDPRALDPQIFRYSHPCQKHHSCGARSP